MKPKNFYRKTQDRVSFAREVLDAFWDEIAEAKRILIKPNIVSHEGYPTTTHPDLLDVILEALEGLDVSVGDGVAIDVIGARKALQRHPLKAICDRRGVRLLDFHHGRSGPFKSPRGYILNMTKVPLSYDYVISLPVLKAHGVCGITGALKNQFGYLTKAERLKMHSHFKNIHQGIAEINVLMPPNLFLVDAVETLIGTNEVRHGGKKGNLGYMLAGKDPVLLDSFGVKILGTVDDNLWGKDPIDILHIRYAQQFGLGDPAGDIREV